MGKRERGMKSVLISIQPKWCELIASGKKTVEVRKTKPKLETPFKCYIYETLGKTKWCNTCKDDCERPYPNCACHEGWGKVIGEFVCDRVYDLKCLPNEYSGKPAGTYEQFICENSCLSFDDIKAYGKGASIYGWHISNLVIYDKPRNLNEFCTAPSDDDIRCKYIEKRYTVNGKQYIKCTLQNCICEFKRLGHQTDCDGYEPLNPQKSLTRPPQSWCYVEGAE